jgi:protein arginine kinase activator
MAYGEFKEKGALGCADCYGAFEQELDRLLIEMHGSRIHRGKGSLTLEQLDPAIDIDRLRVDLDRAIRNEEFEQAARLRDRIRNMATDTQGK